MNFYQNTNENFFSNSRVVHLSSAEIKFSQDSIAFCFKDKDKKDLNQTCEKIASREMKLSDIPQIRVTMQNGVFYR